MTQLLNCWQFKNCGREEGGVLADVLGVCPVAVSMKHDGTNNGQAAGRVCWEVARTAPAGLVTCAERGATCQACTFYKRVHFEGVDLPETTKPAIETSTQFAAEVEAK